MKRNYILFVLLFISSYGLVFSQSSNWEDGIGSGQSVYDFSSDSKKGSGGISISGGGSSGSSASSSGSNGGGSYSSSSSDFAPINSFSSSNEMSGKSSKQEISNDESYSLANIEEMNEVAGAGAIVSSAKRSTNWLPDPEKDATSEGEKLPIGSGFLHILLLLAAVYAGYSAIRYRKEQSYH